MYEGGSLGPLTKHRSAHSVGTARQGQAIERALHQLEDLARLADGALKERDTKEHQDTETR